jgi:hypothetical protein
LVDAKSNLAPRVVDCPLYRLLSVELPNPEPPLYPNGDNVQAITRVVLPIQPSGVASAEDMKIEAVILEVVDHGKRTSGETVIIDGLCASACAIVLGAVPNDRIRVTSRANLGFHAAWDFGANGREVINPDATQMLYSMHPSPVRRWIATRGGLKPQMIFLRGKQLMNMYRPCYLDAQASSPR